MREIKKLGFSKEVRLRTPAGFKAVFDEPIRVSSEFLLFLARPNQTERARLGLIVAKRYVKKAVDRNRIRRIIRENFRHHQEPLKGLDLVVLFRKSLPDRAWISSFNQVLNQQRKELLRRWKKS